MKTVELKCPAKLNLFLEVRDKRSDGYHNIETVFEKVDLCDIIRLTETTADVKLSLPARIRAGQAGLPHKSTLPEGRKNLAFRAAELVRKTYKIPLGIDIELEKNIPVAAGLGGGSSDAAAVLTGLNDMWYLRLEPEELVKLGRQLGADVPFFLFNQAFAVGTARGDEISPVKSGLEMWHLLICPPVQVATIDVYNDIGSEASLGLTEERPDAKMIVRALQEKDADGVQSGLYNALEQTVCRQVSQITMVKDYFRNKWGRPALMTGSGPTVFIVTDSGEEALRFRDAFLDSLKAEDRREEWRAFTVKTLAQN